MRRVREHLHGLREHKGQAVVEFVLLFPFAMLFILFVIEFGFVLYCYINVIQSTAEGARFAAVGNRVSSGSCTPNDGSIQGRTVYMSAGILTCAEVVVRYQPNPAPFDRGDIVGVEVTHNYTPVTGIGGIISMLSGGTFPSTIPMSSCFEARLEVTPSNQTGMVSGTVCG